MDDKITAHTREMGSDCCAANLCSAAPATPVIHKSDHANASDWPLHSYCTPVIAFKGAHLLISTDGNYERLMLLTVRELNRMRSSQPSMLQRPCVPHGNGMSPMWILSFM